MREDLEFAIENVEGAEYERCTDDDMRLNYLMGKKESLADIVRVLENLRAKERVISALDNYLLEKQQSGCYSEEALAQIAQMVQQYKDGLDTIDTSVPGQLDSIQAVLNDGLAQLNDVRAATVVAGGDAFSDLNDEQYDDQPSVLKGYLQRDGGFSGDSKLTLALMTEDAVKEASYTALFGAVIQLTGDDLSGKIQICVLLPENARGYSSYSVKVVTAYGETVVQGAAQNDMLTFTIDGDDAASAAAISAEFSGAAQFVVMGNQDIDLTWLTVLLACLVAVGALALGYVLLYTFKKRAVAFLPAFAAFIVAPAVMTIISMTAVYIALGAVCAAEAAAIVALLLAIKSREKKAAN